MLDERASRIIYINPMNRNRYAERKNGINIFLRLTNGDCIVKLVYSKSAIGFHNKANMLISIILCFISTFCEL